MSLIIFVIKKRNKNSPCQTSLSVKILFFLPLISDFIIGVLIHAPTAS